MKLTVFKITSILRRDKVDMKKRLFETGVCPAEFWINYWFYRFLSVSIHYIFLDHFRFLKLSEQIFSNAI